MSAGNGVGSGSRQVAQAVDNTDYLKTAAILLVLPDLARVGDTSKGGLPWRPTSTNQLSTEYDVTPT